MIRKTWTYPYPGKFEGLTLAQFLVALPVAVDSVEDDFAVDEVTGEFAARIRLTEDAISDFVGYLLDESADILQTITADMLADAVRTLQDYHDAIVFRDSNGFYHVRLLHKEEAAEAWDEIVYELGNPEED